MNEGLGRQLTHHLEAGLGDGPSGFTSFSFFLFSFQDAELKKIATGQKVGVFPWNGAVPESHFRSD